MSGGKLAHDTAESVNDNCQLDENNTFYTDFLFQNIPLFSIVLQTISNHYLETPIAYTISKNESNLKVI